MPLTFTEALGVVADHIRDATNMVERVDRLNQARRALHAVSPFRGEPVDLVEWVPVDTVAPNAYNPNVVASREMALLYLSILEDGYTMPIVSYALPEGREVVDGFHRTRVGREHADIRARVHGYLPVSTIDKPLGERYLSTQRHNKARGKHTIPGEATNIRALLAMGYGDADICERMGKTPEELLRLKQTLGAAALMAAEEYNEFYGREDEPPLPPEDEP